MKFAAPNSARRPDVLIDGLMANRCSHWNSGRTTPRAVIANCWKCFLPEIFPSKSGLLPDEHCNRTTENVPGNFATDKPGARIPHTFARSLADVYAGAAAIHFELVWTGNVTRVRLPHRLLRTVSHATPLAAVGSDGSACVQKKDFRSVKMGYFSTSGLPSLFHVGSLQRRPTRGIPNPLRGVPSARTSMAELLP